MINTIKASLIRRLQESGIEAAGAYGGEALPPRGSLVTAAVRKAGLQEPGLSRYLGLSGETGELWGLRCTLELALEVYAADIGSCEETADRLMLALAGIRELGLRSFSCAAPVYDRAAGLFRCACSAEAAALVTAEAAQGEESEFADFILKGEIRK